jgi:hypothetical protein
MLENRTADIDKPVKRRMRAPSVKGKEVKSPLRYRVSFLIWMLILITQVGVFLWLAYFRRPHISIKLIISVIWLFWKRLSLMDRLPKGVRSYGSAVIFL